MFKIKGMPNRIQASYIHNAWAVVANIADCKTLITLAAFNTPLYKCMMLTMKTKPSVDYFVK
jgi:hypothetical protein